MVRIKHEGGDRWTLNATSIRQMHELLHWADGVSGRADVTVTAVEERVWRMEEDKENVVDDAKEEVKEDGKEDDNDSMVSGHSMSRLQKKANLELVWQKANSINGEEISRVKKYNIYDMYLSYMTKLGQVCVTINSLTS